MVAIKIWSHLAGLASPASAYWRERSDTRLDNHVGKAALFLFFNLAIFSLLFGLTLSSLNWFEYLFKPAVAAQMARQTMTQTPTLPEADPSPMNDPAPQQASVVMPAAE